MIDPRIPQLAEQLIGYSTHLKRGEVVLIDLFDVPEEVGICLIRAARAKGAIPLLKLNSGRLSRELGMGATEAQYDLIAELDMAQMEKVDAYIAIRGSDNIAEASDVPAKRKQLVMEKTRPVLDKRVNDTKWCVLRWPTPSMAQQAGMSTEAFEDFYFRACLLDYKSLLPGMRALRKLMTATDEVRLTGPGTDLRFSMKDIPAVLSGGNYNVPDGEVFSAPVKESVEGTIFYNAPSIYRGIPFEQVTLTFEKGKIVKATGASDSQTKDLKRIFDSDPGARYVGEFALGFHPEIREPMRDILFDEKIAGSFHFTPGQAYEEADNGNRSQVHWDLVSIQRPEWGGGTVEFDGKVIRKDGLFLPKNLQSLNYE